MKNQLGVFRAFCLVALCCYAIAFSSELVPLPGLIIAVSSQLADILVVFTTILRVRFFLNDTKLKLPDKLLYISGVCLLLIAWFPVWGEVLRSSPFGPSFIVLAIIFLTFIGAQIMYHQVSFRLRLLISLVITGYVALCLIRPAIN